MCPTLLVVLLQGSGPGSALPQSTTQLSPPVALQQPTAPSPSAQPSNEQSQSQLQRLLQALASAAASSTNSASSTAGAPTRLGPSSSSSVPAVAGSSVPSSVDTAALSRSLAGVVAQMSRSGAGREPQLPPHSLLDVLQPDRVLPLLDEDQLRQLVALLPSDSSTVATPATATATATAAAATATGTAAAAASLSLHLRSAQFSQTAGRMQSLLYSENYGSLLSSLGLDTSAGGFGVEGLVAAIERRVKLDREKDGAAASSASQQPQQQPQ